MRATSYAERILNKKRIKNDLVLILILLTVALSAFFIIESLREDGVSVRVTVNGELAAEYLLSRDGEYVLNGGTNVLVISNGEAYVKEASCPDGLCINQGKISLSGERIVCLPNRVMIEVIGDDGIFIN